MKTEELLHAGDPGEERGKGGTTWHGSICLWHQLPAPTLWPSAGLSTKAAAPSASAQMIGLQGKKTASAFDSVMPFDEGGGAGSGHGDTLKDSSFDFEDTSALINPTNK